MPSWNTLLLATSCALMATAGVRCGLSLDSNGVLPGDGRQRHHGRHGHKLRHHKKQRTSHNEVLQISDWLESFPTKTSPMTTSKPMESISKSSKIGFYSVTDTSVKRYSVNPPVSMIDKHLNTNRYVLTVNK